MGHIIVLGYLATVMIAGVENAILTGGLSALGAALYSLGIPKDSVLEYETAVKANDFLVAVHGTPAEMTGARSIFQTTSAHRVATHGDHGAATGAPLAEVA